MRKKENLVVSVEGVLVRVIFACVAEGGDGTWGLLQKFFDFAL